MDKAEPFAYAVLMYGTGDFRNDRVIGLTDHPDAIVVVGISTYNYGKEVAAEAEAENRHEAASVARARVKECGEAVARAIKEAQEIGGTLICPRESIMGIVFPE